MVVSVERYLKDSIGGVRDSQPLGPLFWVLLTAYLSSVNVTEPLLSPLTNIIIRKIDIFIVDPSSLFNQPYLSDGVTHDIKPATESLSHLDFLRKSTELDC